MMASDGQRLTRTERTLRWCAAGGIAVLLGAVFLWPPDTLVPTPCTFRNLTGLSCLTCGMTRSLHSFSHGDVSGALGYHLMGPVLFVAAILFGVLWAVEAAGGERFRAPVMPAAQKIMAGTIGAVWIGYWIVRLVGELS